MDLTLSSTQQRLLVEIQSRLLAPLSYPDVGAWSRAISDPAKRLFGAERGGLLLPHDGRLDVLPDDGYEPHSLSLYPELTHEMDRRFRYFERAAELGAYTRRAVLGDDLDGYRHSAYFNDYIVPNQFFGAMGLVEPLQASFDVTTVGQFLLHRASEDDGDPARDLALLRLLRPAFQAGVWMWRQATDRRLELDAFSDPVLLVACDGSIAHRNEAAVRLLEDPRGASAVEASVHEVARLLLALEGQAAEVPDAARWAAPVAGRYRLMATRVPPHRYGGQVIGMIVLQDVRPALPGPEELRSRFDMTRRQAEVAVLLAERKRNDEIAAALHISPHTAKRHTEAVLMKLDVPSRDDVERVLRGS